MTGDATAARTVLVVDDDDSIRMVAEVALDSVGGWNVLSAAGGMAGLELAREHRPDAILLDVMMPDMDGPATLQHLRDDPVTRDIPVVLITAKVQLGETPVWAGLPIAGVIRKPFDPMTLAADVAAMLGWS